MPGGEQGPVGRGSPWAGPDKYLQLFSSFLASTAPLAGSQSRLFRPGVSSDAASTLSPYKGSWAEVGCAAQVTDGTLVDHHRSGPQAPTLLRSPLPFRPGSRSPQRSEKAGVMTLSKQPFFLSQIVHSFLRFIRTSVYFPQNIYQLTMHCAIY